MGWERDERPRQHGLAPVPAEREAEDVHLLHRLQSSAGNQAVAQLLAGQGRGPRLPGARVTAGTAASTTAVATVQRNQKFDLAVGKAYDKADAPDALAVPAELKDGLEAAWAASFPEGTSLEQGGILVKTKDGAYVWKPGKGTSGGSFSPNYGDVGPDEVLVASGHTHPYDESEGGHTDIAFSGGDLSNLVWQQERFKLVQSGTSQFGVGKTAEFDKLVAAADTPEKKLTLRKEMNALWDTTFKQAEGAFAEKVKKASTTVCEKYHLVYYAGSAGTLSQPKATPKVHVESPSPVIPPSPSSLPPVEQGPGTEAPEQAQAPAPAPAPAKQGLLARLRDWLGRLAR